MEGLNRRKLISLRFHFLNKTISLVAIVLVFFSFLTKKVEKTRKVITPFKRPENRSSSRICSSSKSNLLC